MSDAPKGQISTRTVHIALAGFAALSASPFALTWYFNERAIQLCEERIKAEIRSPSSYQRIKVDGSGVFDIEFDAANSFGTPIRGSASCVAQYGEVKVFFLRPDGQE